MIFKQNFYRNKLKAFRIETLPRYTRTAEHITLTKAFAPSGKEFIRLSKNSRSEKELLTNGVKRDIIK